MISPRGYDLNATSSDDDSDNSSDDSEYEYEYRQLTKYETLKQTVLSPFVNQTFIDTEDELKAQ